MSWNTDRFITGTLMDGSIRTVRELAEAGQLSPETVRTHVRGLCYAGALTRHPGRPPAYSLACLAPQSPNAEVFIRAALTKLDRRLDPLPELAAAVAVLLIEQHEMPPHDLESLEAWARDISEYGPD